jgi:hypothetical protein
VEVFRDKELIALGKAAKLQIGKMDMPTVERDQECGACNMKASPLSKKAISCNFTKIEKLRKKYNYTLTNIR